MKVLTDPQRSAEWIASRVGRLCGSRAKDMLAVIKTGEAAARRDLRLQLVCERLTGQPQEDAFISADMQRGIDKEADALAAYEDLTGHMVMPVGFCQHESLMAGCSPDGQIDGFTGIIEIKVPKTSTHIGYLKAGAAPSNHLAQITHNLWITGAQWCDFFSFDDRLPKALQCFCVRVERVDIDIAAYDGRAKAFLAEIDRDIAELTQLAVA